MSVHIGTMRYSIATPMPPLGNEVPTCIQFPRWLRVLARDGCDVTIPLRLLEHLPVEKKMKLLNFSQAEEIDVKQFGF